MTSGLLSAICRGAWMPCTARDNSAGAVRAAAGGQL